MTISKDYNIDVPNFSNYDLIVIDEKLFSDKILQELKINNCKVIALSNIFKTHEEYENSKNADIQLIKPLIKKQVSDTLMELYLKKLPNTIKDKNNLIDEEPLLIHKKTFPNAKNINLKRFIQFKETSVLIVEDNLINQKVIIGVLSKASMDITIANDGQEALDILSSDKEFDIVFMDINMPVMDGYTSSKKIRENARFNKLPIIALSALTSTSEVDKMFASGMNGFLPKPLRKEQLFTVFSLFVDKKMDDAEFKEEVIDTIPTFDGLNISQGISNSGSNEAFYKEILSEFNDAYGDSDKIFAELVEDFRYTQLKMLCTDLRGLSGSIGAEGMNKLLIEILQMLLYKKYDLLPTFTEPYKKELNKINNSISKYINYTNSGSSVG